MSEDLSRMYRTAVSDEELPDTLTLMVGDKRNSFRKLSWNIDGNPRGMRYGTNPHQAAAIYVPGDRRRFLARMEWRKWGKDGPSATNIEDGYRALRIVHYFNRPAVAVMKHLNPTGVGIACEDERVDVFEKAWSGDPRAAYGSVVGFNFHIDKNVAETIVQRYVECLFAPSYSSEALEIFEEEKKNLRAAEVPDVDVLQKEMFPYEIRILGNILVLERTFSTKIRGLDDLKDCRCVTKKKPDEDEVRNMLYSWWVCCEKRSNGVVIWKKDKVLAVGTGQQDRIGAIEIALDRAERAGHDLRGSVLASDGFMLRDNIEPLVRVGVSAIIQPGGSRYDDKVIEQCDEYGIPMVFTQERVFRHF